MAEKRGDNAVLEMLRAMGEKMDQMSERLNSVETTLKEENKKLRDKLDRAEKRYDEVCIKVNEMAYQINRLKQDNLSRNLMVKGVPEIERDTEHLKVMMGQIFEKLRFNFPMTYVDCYRIGRRKENTCRPIVVVLPNIGLKNLIIRDKRSMMMTAANFRDNSIPWGSQDSVIYMDEHLTHENHMLFMYTRKLKLHGYKYIWSRNGRIFARINEKAKVVSVESAAQVNKMIVEAKFTIPVVVNQPEDAGNPTSNDTEEHTERETEEEDPLEPEVADKYLHLVDNTPKPRRTKRKNNSPSNIDHHGKNHGRPLKARK